MKPDRSAAAGKSLREYLATSKEDFAWATRTLLFVLRWKTWDAGDAPLLINEAASVAKGAASLAEVQQLALAVADRLAHDLGIYPTTPVDEWGKPIDLDDPTPEEGWARVDELLGPGYLGVRRCP